jgi:PadR family transcriptional regulator PadR
MLKGLLEGVVLSIISRKRTYGYEITKQLQGMGFHGIVDGTVYTILTRLERRNLVTTKRCIEDNVVRKYYALNKAGQNELKAFWQRWEHVSELLNNAKEQNNDKNHQ